MKTIAITFLSMVIWLANSSSQQSVDLVTAINIAQEKSIEVQQAFLQSRGAEISQTQARHSRFPSLNAGGSYGQSFGRTIDPTSNSFVTENIGYNSWNASTSINLFNGGRIHHTIQQAQLDLASADASLEQVKRDIALNVAISYLAILSAQDRLQNAQNQYNLAEDQVNRVQSLIDAGSQAENAILDVQAQLLSNEQSVIIAENQVELAYLSLKKWLRMEGEEIEIVRPTIDDVELTMEMIPSVETLYRSAMNYDYSIKADSLGILAAEKGTKIARASYFPSLSLGGNLTSNYSTQGKKIVGQNEVVNFIPITFMGQDAEIGFPQSVPIIENSAYGEQMKNNFGYSFGLNLNIPIYNNYRVKAQVQQAELGVIRQELQYENNKFLLRQEVVNARAEAIAAQKLYAAAVKSSEALESAYGNMLKRFENGMSNNYDLITAKSRLENAQNNMINARFDLLFKLKVIDYYLGKEITIN